MKMKFEAPLLAGLLLSVLNAHAAPSAVVIEQHSSQISETLTAKSPLSFAPMAGSVVPMEHHYSSFQLPENTNIALKNWTEHLGQPVKVEHKQRELSLEGTLEAVSGNHFTLSVQRVAAQYPISDFYLIPKLAAVTSRKSVSYQGLLTYRTEELSWSPELTLIVEDNQVTLVQQANVQNRSANDLALNEALLHYKSSRPVLRQMSKNVAMMESMAVPDTQYNDSEITIELSGLSLPATSETLVDLGKHTSPIKQRHNVANVYSYSSRSTIALDFNQEIQFDSPKDLLPGSYTTLWHKKPYFLHGNSVALTNTRQGSPLTATLNKSLDIKGELTLISETQNEDLTTQTWELTLENLSRQNQSYRITHQTQQTIKEVSPKSIEQNTANSLVIDGSLSPNNSNKIRYTVNLQNRR